MPDTDNPLLLLLASLVCLFQFAFVLAGPVVLVRQWRAAPVPSAALPPWRIEAGPFGVFVLLMMGGFVVVSVFAGAPFVEMTETVGADGALERHWATSPTVTFAANCVAQIVVGAAIFFAVRRLSPGFAFNFPDLSRTTPKAWKTIPCILGALVVALGTFQLVEGLLWVLQQGGLAWDFPRQEVVDSLLENRGDPGLLAIAFLSVVIGAPVCEELFFRGCVYRFLKNHTGPRAAALFTGVVFGLIHFNVQSFLPLAVLGAYLCFVYERTGDIRVPVLVHSVFNLNSFLLMQLLPDLMAKT